MNGPVSLDQRGFCVVSSVSAPVLFVAWRELDEPDTSATLGDAHLLALLCFPFLQTDHNHLKETKCAMNSSQHKAIANVTHRNKIYALSEIE